jgi:hypothetical protein
MQSRKFVISDVHMRESADSSTQSAHARAPLGPASAQLSAWALLVVVNQVFIARLDRPPGRASVALWHHLYDAGHLLALGVISWLVVELWRRWGPRHAAWALLGLGVLAFSVGWLTLGTDLTGFVERRQRSGSLLPWRGIATAIAALAVVAAAALGRALDRSRLRWLAVAGGLTIGVLNNWLLRFDYFGIHLLAHWSAALLIGGALTSARSPLRLSLPRRRWAKLALISTLAVASGWTLIRLPSRSVWRELYRVPGSVVAPQLAKVLPAERRSRYTPLPFEATSWFVTRQHRPAVPPSSPPLLPPDAIVILITVDALRTDLVEEDQHAQALPAIHRLRRESLRFTNARAPSSSTLTTLYAMATGKYYSATYWSSFDNREGHFPHQDENTRLQQIFSQAGIRTVQPVSVYGLGKEDGFGVGFDEELRTSHDYGRAKELMDITLARLEKGFAGPAFMFMHFVDPHAPYNLAGTHGTPWERYLREVQLVDRELGRLADHLRSSGLDRRTLLIVAADHGEAFGEHGTHYHAVTVYDELLRVPLMFAGPGLAPAVVDHPVTLMDLGPTLLDLYGLPTPGAWMGQSLVPFMRGKRPSLDRPIAADAGRRMQAMVFPDGIKVIEDIRKKTVEIYNLQKDPAELENVVDRMGAEGEQYISAMRRFFATHALPKPGYEPPMRQF